MNKTNHPNRSKKIPSPARSPAPAEVVALRMSAGLTQAEMAQKLNTSTRTYQQWESNTPGDTRRMHPTFFELMQLKLGAHKEYVLVQKIV